MYQLPIVTTYFDSDARPDLYMLVSDKPLVHFDVVNRLRQLHQQEWEYRCSDDYNQLDYADMLVAAVAKEFGARVQLMTPVQLEITAQSDALIN